MKNLRHAVVVKSPLVLASPVFHLFVVRSILFEIQTFYVLDYNFRFHRFASIVHKDLGVNAEIKLSQTDKFAEDIGDNLMSFR